MRLSQLLYRRCHQQARVGQLVERHAFQLESLWPPAKRQAAALLHHAGRYQDLVKVAKYA
jgi:hypothetical protein